MKNLHRLTSCHIISNGTTAETLTQFIHRTVPLYLAGESTSLAEAHQAIVVSRPDITFCEFGTEAPQWMEWLELMCRHTCLVAISGNDKAALSLYKRFTVDFLMLPLSYDDFVRVLGKTQLMISKALEPPGVGDPQSFYVTEEKGRLVRILYEDILYIQAAHNYVRIQLATIHYLVYLSLKEMEQALPGHQFIRVHKSYIVNIRQIRAIEWNKILFPQGGEVQIGESYKQQFMQIINQSLISIRKGE
ncbi:LytR/AlgR family response regulator transcription factor [Chitinophaga lutea]